MGYTHYWTQTRNFTKDDMLTIGDAVSRIIRTAIGREYPNRYCGDDHPGTLVICGGDGNDKPVLAETTISFNGENPDLSHESFTFHAERTLPYAGASADTIG